MVQEKERKRNQEGREIKILTEKQRVKRRLKMKSASRVKIMK